jgi:exosome complex component CSL4
MTDLSKHYSMSPIPVALPGDVLGSATTHLAGPGTHVYDSNICASIIGSVSTTPSSKSGKFTMTIPRAPSKPSVQPLTTNTLPALNSALLCRITRVQQRQASASILVINPSPTTLIPNSLSHLATTTASAEDTYFSAVLRREDVRLTEKDKVVMNESFRVGDIVRATVISLGDEKNYYISTGGNEFGVVIARSEEGNAMVPASWKEMRDVISGKVELRKVAKPA